jgi:hypothetical protein
MAMRACSYLVTIGLALQQQRTTEYLEHRGSLGLRLRKSVASNSLSTALCERENRLMQG